MHNERYLSRTVYEKLLAWRKRDQRKTLEISGTRQTGKTYLVNKLADEEYKHKVYINLLDYSGENLLRKYYKLDDEISDMPMNNANPMKELLKKYDPNFEDTPETVVIIDEIQESADIYNRIREFTRNFQCDFIIIGSYLGRILDKSFKYSSGDIESIEINTLSFEEFLDAYDQYELYKIMDLYGGSSDHVYSKLARAYNIYSRIGGYPRVVLQYLKTGSFEQSEEELIQIIRLFINESRRYFHDILDAAVYESLFCAVARILAKEKKDLDNNNISEDLQELVEKDYSSNISKAVVNRAMDWLYSSGIIAYAGKITNFDVLNLRPKARYYFMDLGLAYYFLDKIGLVESQINGIICENFVFLDLKKRLNSPAEIVFEVPVFATYGNGELDFFVRSRKSKKDYAVEVKAGKNSSNTIRNILENKKVDYVLYAKGNTKGGIRDNIFTIPIYAITKFKFN